VGGVEDVLCIIKGAHICLFRFHVFWLLVAVCYELYYFVCVSISISSEYRELELVSRININ
jgi:hypothetical protein